MESEKVVASSRSVSLTQLRTVRKSSESTLSKFRLTIVSVLCFLGDVHHTREQLCFPGGSRPNPKDLNMLQDLEQYMTNLSNYRRSDFEVVLKEMNENVHFGINSTPQLLTCKVEAYLKGNRLNSAILTISHLREDATTFSDSMIFGMISDFYILLGYSQNHPFC
ncbi:hypothetical protein M569_15247 [Genlisea aurea]|uniref:Uncharacterized protein n=1 Tax=Genlisea aurea TaxID=192259 RepID=S8DA34_9LAMI|nr:hypothetical protein M569_15247 [Genlisea aurea]